MDTRLITARHLFKKLTARSGPNSAPCVSIGMSLRCYGLRGYQRANAVYHNCRNRVEKAHVAYCCTDYHLASGRKLLKHSMNGNTTMHHTL